MGLVCGTSTRFNPTAAARTAQAKTITPALGAEVNKKYPNVFSKVISILMKIFIFFNMSFGKEPHSLFHIVKHLRPKSDLGVGIGLVGWGVEV